MSWRPICGSRKNRDETERFESRLKAMENIEAMLCAYVEGDLDATGRAQIEKHLKDHPQHRKLLDELKTMRDLVRSLPRAQAPMDVGDSLRQKVERSMLLDSASAPPARERVDRWPQFFGIAAIFLLVASLCFIVIRTLGPTLKPPVFTQNVAVNRSPELVLPEQPAALPMTATPATTQPTPLPENSVVHTSQLDANDQTSLAGAATQPAIQQNALGMVKPDFDSIRRRLENSGFGIHNDQNAPGPMLVVVDSNNVPSTKVQIAQFFSSNAGITLSPVPSETQTSASPTTMPGTMNAQAQAISPAQSAADNLLMDRLRDAGSAPTGDLFIARGLTPQQADALRQTLTGSTNGSQVQVSVQSAQGLATTQSSAPVAQAAGANRMLAPATQPTGLMDKTVADFAGATSQPSAMFEVANGKTDAQPQPLLPVDAVILLRKAAVPSTQPSSMLIPATQP
jgi:hypothetical protein